MLGRQVILRDNVTVEEGEERGTLPHASTDGGISASAANLKLKKWTNKPEEHASHGEEWPSLRRYSVIGRLASGVRKGNLAYDEHPKRYEFPGS